MRLLHFESDKLVLTNFTGKPIPPFAILSHRWTAEEVLYDDVKRGNFKQDSAGWKKIRFCAEKAAADNLKYFWCDTCCINKWDTAELARSVNSMFKYYRDAAKCYIYLQDTKSAANTSAEPPSTAEENFRQNEWFKRGWTLQELVAPSSVEFFNEQGQRLGDRTSFRQTIHEITGIPLEALDGDLEKFDQENRLKWAEGRVTTEPEDGAYCLLGILGVQMPLTYGEGREKAFARLYRELEADTKAPCLIPFSRKDNTIGSASTLLELEQKLFGDQRSRCLTIVGGGGLGKSHLALEFAYFTRESRANCSVFWCDASNINSLHQSYSDVAQKLQIASDQDQPDEVRTKLHRHLSGTNAGEWLLIYDNVEDAASLSAGLGAWTSAPLDEHLPKSPTGFILLTTRNSGVSHAISSESIQLVDLDVPSSAAMLQAYLADLVPAAQENAAMAQLARQLRKPLAIVIATAYIRTEGINVEEYLALLERCAGDVEEGSPAASAVIASAEQSINQVIKFTLSRVMDTNSVATQCLLELGCLHRTDIPLNLIYASINNDTQNVLATLEGYALITRRPALSAVDMHSLVHLAVRQVLDDLEHRGKCVCWVISKLLDTFPEVDENSRSQWRRLLPHAYELFSVAHDEEKDALLGLKYRCGKALYYDGRFHEAKELQAEVLESATRLKMHDDIISVSKDNLAATLGQLGQWREAEQFQARGLDMSEAVSGDDTQISVLAQMNNLASTYWKQGKWKEAEALQLKAMKKSETAHGLDHHLTLSIMTNLAMTLRDQGRWQEAADLQLQVCETMSKTLGADHPTVLTNNSSLALTYRHQGRLKEAEVLFTQVLATEKVILGPNHPHTLVTMNHLATTISDQGRYEAAEKLHLQVLEISKQVHGETHNDTMSSANNLSNLYMYQGRTREAGDILNKLLDTAKTVLGADHPSVVICRNNLAGVYLSQGRFVEAEELEIEALRIAKRVLGHNHPELVAIMNGLASAVSGQKQWVKARELQEEVLWRCKASLGPQHPNSLTCMKNLAMTYARLHRWRDAEWVMTEVFRSRKAGLGPNHPQTLVAERNLFGLLLCYMRRFNPSTEWRLFRYALGVKVARLWEEMKR